MTRRRFGPEHDITGEALYVPGSDSSWDHDRVQVEVKKLRGAGKYKDAPSTLPEDIDDPAREHVFFRYYRGVTRYDLDAEGMREYLGEGAETFSMRRLSGGDRARALRLRQDDREREAAEIGFCRGVKGVENFTPPQRKSGDETPPPDLEALLKAREAKDTVGGRLVSDNDILAAADAVAYEIVEDIGAAVLALSRDLSEVEKKL